MKRFDDMHTSRFALMACSFLGCAFGADRCHAQWSKLAQADLRRFTETVVVNKTIYVDPPKIKRPPGMLTIDMGDFPRQFTNDPLFDRALDAQLQATVIRVYRNKPAFRKAWAPTLAAVERKVHQMLAVLALRNITDDVREQSIDAIENDIQAIYDAHFREWAKKENRDGFEYEKGARTYLVELITDPEGVVSYLPSGDWQLYLFATKEKKLSDIPTPEWRTPPNAKVSLVGEYYFYARFPNHEKPVQTPEPVLITSDGSLLFTPDGLRQR